jgi:4-amino-4-deoxy-L-arabinose transferase-like glycosyltransferase
MKNKGFIFITTIFLLIIFFSQLKLVNHPVKDNDEGIYLTSFLLVDRGHPAYKETFFSQPPGFLLSVYPGFMLFGKTLQSARFTIGIWSLIGLLAILWIGFELKNKWAGLFAIALLFLIPSYYNQSLTFQSDILISTFSLLSLAALIRFGKSLRLFWFVVSVLFLNLAFWTKFDITFLPSFILFLFLLFEERKIYVKNIINLFITFFIVSLGFFLIFILPFGIKEVFNNSILLRFQAASSASSSFLLFDYLKKDIVLLLIILGSLFLSLLKRKIIKYPLSIILTWAIFVLTIFIFYKPLFPHHLVILTIPMVLLFSQIVSNYFSNKKLFKFMILIVMVISLGNYVYVAVKTSSKLISSQQQSAIDVIKKYTKPDDEVVSDEEILNGLSGRLPPSALSDVSQIRINSNSLTSEDFIKIINIYKPKLIIPWNGRLQSIKNFNEVLRDYKIIYLSSDSKKFILLRQ